MKRYTTAEVIATHINWDIVDVKENSYQNTRTNASVYSIGKYYYCAIRKGKKPPKHTDNASRFVWQSVKSSFADSIGYEIYLSE
jgi:hypothetical protein